MTEEEEDALEEDFEDEVAENRVRKGRIRRKKRKRSEAKEPKPKEPRRRFGLLRRREGGKTTKEELGEEDGISQGRLWFKQNWMVMLTLFLLFLFALFLRSYFYYGVATENGYMLSGNDPYYHKRVADYVQENGRHLIFDPLLSYPDGALNPRPPMFDWSIAVLGMMFSPLFGGDVGVATWEVILFSPAFWGALTVVPVYLIGREMFNKRTGLLAAFLIAVMPSHVERSPLGFSDHDAIVVFFVVLSFFFFIKALNTLTVRDKWVINWRKPREITHGLRKWLRYNHVPVAFSLLTGLALASIAFTWKGFLYPVVIIIVYLFIQLILNKLRNKDSLGVAICTLIPVAIVAFLPAPYYWGNHLQNTLIPAILIFIGVLIISIIFIVTRDSPWLMVFPTLAIVLTGGFILMIYVFPQMGQSLFSGQGYFIQTKIFSTIAEAQAPDWSRLVFSYGVVTTFLAFFAIMLMVIRILKDIRAHFLFMTIWGVTAIYMAMSATRFVFNAGPVFAILAGWMVHSLIVKLDFRKMRKAYRGLKGGGRFYAMRKSVKVRHIVGVLFLIFLIFLPNIWLGWDAGIPYEEKKNVDLAVYDAFPGFMKPEEYDSDKWSTEGTDAYPGGVGNMYNRTRQDQLWYFGAFGHAFPRDYWMDGMEWLSEQDTELPVEDRPAFISWWDYGFWCVYLGEHPTAADNFQGRVQFAGSFISSQNESQAISLMAARILEADKGNYHKEYGKFRLHDGVRDILVKYFGQEKADEIEDVVVNPSKYVDELQDNPDRYGHYSADLFEDITPIYAILQTWIPELLSDEERVWLLHEIQEETDDSFRYFAIDSRLFPFGPGNTGIFYAPLKLSDHRINEYNEPYDYLRTYITDVNGLEHTYEEWKVATEKDPNLRAQKSTLKYFDPFLNSMLYKCYLGYTLDDIGAEDQSISDPYNKYVQPYLPVVHDQSYLPMQGWMMKHFQLVYRTGYWSPHNRSMADYYPDDWEAMDFEDAQMMKNDLETDGIDNNNNGETDEEGEGGDVRWGINSGVVFIKYYEGAYLNGTITTSKGTPIPNARVSVLDEYFIPHDTVFTDENGSYRLIAPGGNVTVYVSAGGMELKSQQIIGGNVLYQVEEMVFNDTYINISDDQVMRRNVDEDGDGIWDYNIVQDFEIDPCRLNGSVYWDMDSNENLNEGDYDISGANITVINTDLDIEYSVFSEDNGTFLFDDLVPGEYEISLEVQGHTLKLEATEEFVMPGQEKTKDLGVKPAKLSGILSSISDVGFVAQELKLLDSSNDTTVTTNSNSEGYYSFEFLLPGNYTLYVDMVGYEAYEVEMTLAEDESIEKNITLRPSTRIEGTVSNAVTGLPISNVTIRYTGLEENRDRVWYVRGNESGFYELNIRNGNYWVQIKHDLGEETPYMYFEEIELQGGIMTHDIQLDRSVKVFGTVFNDKNGNGSAEANETMGQVTVYFQNSNGYFSGVSNSTGYYRVFLPLGNYTFNAEGGLGIVNDTFSYWNTLSLTEFGQVELNISFEEAERITGVTYYDLNNDTIIDGSERLPYVELNFTDEEGISFIITTNDEGEYDIHLLKNSNYSVIAGCFGYDPYYLPLMNISDLAPQSDFNMTPTKITIFGKTQYESITVGNVNLSFSAVIDTGSKDDNSTSNSTGDYSADLMPGEYHILVDFYTTEIGKPVRYLYNDTLYLDIGEGSRTMDLNLTKKVKINGTTNGTSENVTIYFEAINEEAAVENTTTSNGSFEIFIVPDEHMVWVDHGIDITTHYVYLNTLNLSDSQTIELNLTLGTRVLGEIEYEGSDESGVEISFSNNGSMRDTSDAGRYEVFLPPNRTYEVTVNQTVYDDDKEYWFNYSGNITVTNDTVYGHKIAINKFIKISGQTYIDWNDDGEMDPEEVIGNITIDFEKDGDITTAVSNTSGVYEVFLELEEEFEYTLSSDFAIIDEDITITAEDDDDPIDIQVIPANLTLNGITRNDESPLGHTTLSLSALSSSAINTTTISDATGNYSVDLSYGEYALHCKKVSGSEFFVYLDKITVGPRENLVIDLNLTSGLRVGGKIYYINSTGENLSAQTQIYFEGEAEKAVKSNEEGQFELWLPNGTYQVESEITRTEYDMAMEYRYERTLDITEDTALYIELSKEKDYAVALEWIEGMAATIPQNGSARYNISINNTGNVEDTYYFARDGVADWNLTFPDKITLGINESEIFEVNIQTSPDAVVEHGTITISAVSLANPSVTSSVVIEVNIEQVHMAANLSYDSLPIVARSNTLTYPLRVENIGNGKDTFNLSLSNVPADWNATLVETGLELSAGESKNINLTIIMPYNTTQRDAVITLKAASEVNSTFEIEISLPNLEIGENDVSVEEGDEVSSGVLNTAPIPGFEVLGVIAALFAVAVIKRRRGAK